MSYPDVVKARAISPSLLNEASLRHAIGPNRAMFTWWDPAKASSENIAACYLAGMEFRKMNLIFQTLTARFSSGKSEAIPFFCLGPLKRESFLDMARQNSIRMGIYREESLWSLGTVESGLWLVPLGTGAFDANMVASYFANLFGHPPYFDYPAQTWHHKLYEMVVIQKAPIWDQDSPAGSEE